jgi:hypothetical protein
MDQASLERRREFVRRLGFRHEAGLLVADEGEREMLARVRDMRDRGHSIASVAATLAWR